MKSILVTGLLILSSLFASQPGAATPLEAMLSLPHDRVLPGIPFDLVVTYTNVSNKPVTIEGAQATLVVTFPNGNTEVMDRPEGNDQWHLGDPQAPVQLVPGRSAQLAVSWDHGSIPNWFRYGSYSGPGTYGIALDLRITDLDGNVVTSVRTPAVTLTRVAPAGIDTELWTRMQQVSEGQWSDQSFMTTKPGAALADEIVQVHPESGYYPYILALRALNWPEKQHIRIPALLEAAERFQSSPAYPYLLKAAADLTYWEGLKANREHDAAAAVKHWELAQSYYRDALATKSLAIRASAEKGLRDAVTGLERARKGAR